MNIPGITWKGESIDDVEILQALPPELVRVLDSLNGFILHEGALHVRGASSKPDWHSLRAAWQGPEAFHNLYESVQPTDIPFAQDQIGDQFLLRNGAIFRLCAETGQAEHLADSIEEFISKATNDIESFLNVGLGHTMQPGELLLAFPPFIFQESGASTSLKPTRATEVIRFHADLARQIRDVPDGGQVEFKIID